MISRTL